MSIFGGISSSSMLANKAPGIGNHLIPFLQKMDGREITQINQNDIKLLERAGPFTTLMSIAGLMGGMIISAKITVIKNIHPLAGIAVVFPVGMGGILAGIECSRHVGAAVHRNFPEVLRFQSKWGHYSLDDIRCQRLRDKVALIKQEIDKDTITEASRIQLNLARNHFNTTIRTHERDVQEDWRDYVYD